MGLDAGQRERTADCFAAYAAMETTRQRHFDYLNMLTEREKRFNLQASELEQAFLDQLLADHDLSVKRFKAASESLKARSGEDFQAMFTWFGEIERQLGPIRESDQA